MNERVHIIGLLNKFWNKLLCVGRKKNYTRLMRNYGLRYRSLLRLFRAHIILTNPENSQNSENPPNPENSLYPVQDYVELINKALNSPFIAIDMLLEKKYKLDYYNSPVPQLYHILVKV